jgi:hypothetical protein
VGLSGSGVTKESDLKLARAQRDQAQADAQAYKEQLNEVRKSAGAFSRVYPTVMHDALVGKRIALVFVGPVDGGIASAVDTALTDAGTRPAIRTVSLNVPVDAESLDRALAAGGPQLEKYVGADKLAALGAELGNEFVRGGDTPLWKALGNQLIGERLGNARQRADGVVVVRTAKPQAGDTARFLRGLYGGLASADAPAVGVEETGTTPSAVSTFADRGLSSVDDVEFDTGRAALALLLAGARPGHYGVRDDADAILPPTSG